LYFKLTFLVSVANSEELIRSTIEASVSQLLQVYLD